MSTAATSKTNSQLRYGISEMSVWHDRWTVEKWGDEIRSLALSCQRMVSNSARRLCPSVSVVTYCSSRLQLVYPHPNPQVDASKGWCYGDYWLALEASITPCKWNPRGVKLSYTRLPNFFDKIHLFPIYSHFPVFNGRCVGTSKIESDKKPKMAIFAQYCLGMLYRVSLSACCQNWSKLFYM